MTSKDILNYIEKEGMDKLYKKMENCFKIIDSWSEIFIGGNLLDENELAHSLDQSTGIFAKLCPIVNALDSYMERILNNEESKYYQSQEKVRTQDTSIGKAQARAKVSDIRDYLSDFRSYLSAAQQNIVSAQSRLKRLVVESHAKGVAAHGEVPIDNEPIDVIKPDDPIINEELPSEYNANEKAWDE